MESDATVNGTASGDAIPEPAAHDNDSSDVKELTAQTNTLTLDSRADDQPTDTNAVTPSKISAPTSSFSLSPFAAEFVPRFVPKEPAAVAPKSEYLRRPAQKSSNGDWAAAVAAYDTDAFSASDLEADDYLALSELKEVIDNISSTPANYENMVLHITDILNNCVDEDEDIVLQCVVNTIVDQAITDQNFRYNGVRMCEHLIQHLTIGSAKGSFKDILLQRCQREFARRESMAIATDGGSYLRGVTLFIGDLSTRCVDKELVDWLPDLINTLLQHPTTDNVKSACMVLKLCGSTLDEHYAKQNLPTFEKIFEKLKKMSEDSLNKSVVHILVNVIELRERGWKAPPLPANFYNPYAAGAATGPREATPRYAMAAATGPSASHAPSYGNYGGGGGYGAPNSYDFGNCGDEQDEDVCGAFEEFLRNSGQLN